MSGLIFRALADESEFPLFDTINAPLPTNGVGVRSRTFKDLAADGDYRPEWVWIAQRGDEVVARASFWGRPEFDHPMSLDYFDFDTVENGAALLKAAYAALVGPGYTHPMGYERPEYNLFLPPEWKGLPEAEARIAAAEKAGLEFHVERLNLRWEPEYGLPPRSTRLTFTEAADDALLLGLLEHILEGSLDAWDRKELLSRDVKDVAAEGLQQVADMPGGRDRWRLAYDADGELVGMVMPTHNGSSATIGYIGVDSRHRGHGYAYDLLAEAMHIFADEGQPFITDNTDVGNFPMAAIFDRIGYKVTGKRMIFT
ncbi:GNAT family N-acetyltransferase [Nonomuraea sp. NPDC050556]|uniref:GNAT family N-acetyltransferase n=1 Tax=Nonomuraea sp. NPDC050556 TaxID=3364369 RepID=UPI003794A94D